MAAVDPPKTTLLARLWVGIVLKRHGPAVGMHTEISYDVYLQALDRPADSVTIVNHFPFTRPSKTVDITAATEGDPCVAADSPNGLRVSVPEYVDYSEHCTNGGGGGGVDNPGGGG